MWLHWEIAESVHMKLINNSFVAVKRQLTLKKRISLWYNIPSALENKFIWQQWTWYGIGISVTDKEGKSSAVMLEELKNSTTY